MSFSVLKRSIITPKYHNSSIFCAKYGNHCRLYINSSPGLNQLENQEDLQVSNMVTNTTLCRHIFGLFHLKQSILRTHIYVSMLQVKDA